MKLFAKQDFGAVELKAAPQFGGAYDVIVAGLGSGGFYAAWRAAKLGLRTLGVERMDAFGGQTTIGCVCGTVENQRKRLSELESLAKDAGFEAARQTTVIGAWMEGRRIVGLRLLSNGEIRDVRGKVVIDASGDASVARMAGCRVTVGRESDHGEAAVSKASLFRLPDGKTKMGYGFYRDSAFCDGESFSRKILGYAVRDRKTLGGRQVVVKATIMGSREQGHVVCEDTYTLRDAICERKVDDPIFISRKTPFDLVRIDGDWAWENEDTVAWKQVCGLSNFAFRAAVPYGTIVPKDCEGLLLSAKHYGVAHDAGGGLRMQSHMRYLGLAAAAAAKVAIGKGCALKDVPYAELRSLLTDKGTFADSPQSVNVIYNQYRLEPFDAAAVAKALERPFAEAGNWVTFNPRGPGEDMAWAYFTCWKTYLCGSGEEKRTLGDFLAAKLTGPWAVHFAIALGLMRDGRAIPALLAALTSDVDYDDRLKALAVLRWFKAPQARPVLEAILADDALGFTAGTTDGPKRGFAKDTRDYRRFQVLSYVVFALKELGVDLSGWAKRPLVLACGARDAADLAPMLKAIPSLPKGGKR